ncbi:MAG: beta-N-acetylhexosaminidase [Phycisphaerae bacterium]|nr:beta-N-acetylhexosaminidase [Phycisphaerae bacterium]
MRNVTVFSLMIFFTMFSAIQAEVNIIPTPKTVKINAGEFVVNDETILSYCGIGKQTAFWLSERFQNPTGFKLPIEQFINAPKKNSISFVLDCSGSVTGDEGYSLSVTDSAVVIKAKTEAGLFYGCQSLLQLMPAEICSDKKADIKWTVPCVTIIDEPRYKWRSFMLDSGRQYQSPEFIKRYLDQMAVMKMNRFHWHLTEGQGWRIEIKKYPKLTSVGSKVANGKEQQGFYTHKQIKDIVAYAKKLHIEIVPEIDIPGHSEAALIAYPEYTCFGKPPTSVMAFSPVLFCAGKEQTYKFLEDVLTEVCQLFPSEYIHLGGDEAPKANWKKCPDCQKMIKTHSLKNEHELQIYFTNRFADFLATKNRKVICWGDVVRYPGPPMRKNVVVHWWNHIAGKDKALKEAIKRGHEVICNTNYYTYLNFPVTPWTQYGLGRTFDLKTCYEKNPSDLKLDFSQKHSNIIGMGTCLWTDWFVQEYMVDRRVFPRVYALAEQMWYCGNRVPFEKFYAKLKTHYPRFKAAGIDYGPAMKDEMPKNFKWD